MGKVKKATVKFQRNKLKDVIQRRKEYKNKPSVKRRKKEALRSAGDAGRAGKRAPRDDGDDVEDEAVDEGGAQDMDAELENMSMDEFMDRFGQGMDDGDLSDDAEDGVDVDEDAEEEAGESDDEDVESAADDDDAESDDEDENEVSSRKKQIGDAITHHRAELEALREKDPEFFQYLMENDEDLLQFGEDAEAAPGASEQEDEQDDDEQGADDADDAFEHTPRAGQLLTKEVVIRWGAQLETQRSVHALRRLLAAFRSACHLNDTPDPDKPAPVLPYRIESGSVFNRVIVLTMRYAVPIFDHLLPVGEARPGKPAPLPSTSPRWERLESLVHSFLSNLIHFLRELTDPKLLHYVIKHAERAGPYIACFPRLARKLIKLLLGFWGGASEEVRVVAFLLIRQMAILCPYPFADACLKGAYATFVRNSKFTTAKTLPVVNFMLNCVVELHGLDLATTYQHAFVNVRQLAIHLRNAINAKSKESFRSIYNWQFLNCLRVWTATLSAFATDAASPLRPLVFPLVQIISGTIRLVPSARYYAMRFHCVQLLLDLSAATGVYVPVAPFLLDVLAAPAVAGKPPKESATKRIDLAHHVKVGNAYMKSRAYQDLVVEGALDLLLAHLATLARHIAFPEVVIPIIVQLRRIAKHAKNIKLSKQAQTILQKVDLNRQWVERHRSAVEYSPRDTESVTAFLRNEKPAASPLGAYFASVEAVKRQRRALLASKSDRDEDDDDDVGGSSDDEDAEAAGKGRAAKRASPEADKADKRAKRPKKAALPAPAGDDDDEAEDVVEDFSFSDEE